MVAGASTRPLVGRAVGVDTQAIQLDRPAVGGQAVVERQIGDGIERHHDRSQQPGSSLGDGLAVADGDRFTVGDLAEAQLGMKAVLEGTIQPVILNQRLKR